MAAVNVRFLSARGGKDGRRVQSATILYPHQRKQRFLPQPTKRQLQTIVRVFPGGVLARHVFFPWSARSYIARRDPDFTVFHRAGLFPQYLS